MALKTVKPSKAVLQVQTTLGDLIAAAFDAVGNEVKDVADFLSSPQVGRAVKRPIVLVR
jgi:hypothetical protein